MNGRWLRLPLMFIASLVISCAAVPLGYYILFKLECRIQYSGDNVDMFDQYCIQSKTDAFFTSIGESVFAIILSSFCFLVVMSLYNPIMGQKNTEDRALAKNGKQESSYSSITSYKCKVCNEYKLDSPPSQGGVSGATAGAGIGFFTLGFLTGGLGALAGAALGAAFGGGTTGDVCYDCKYSGSDNGDDL